MQDRFQLHVGDCLEVLRTMPDNSVDAIVTDPPYELGFMGKGWDKSGIANNVEMWREALRVLKPGGHLLAFSGSRTYHRMTVAIEDAGFEVRDQIMWLYGSGFPKSLDVSKAIDKAGGDALAWRAFSEAYAKAVSASGMTHSDIDRSLGIKSSSCYWARTDHRGGMPPRHHWEKVRELLGLSADFTRLYDEAEREVVGHRERGFAPGTNAVYGDYSGDTRITAPATDAARQWQGWGTALKPAHEPICVARKPLVGTVAANVLAHGTGALNIDGCRVETTDDLNGGAYAKEGGRTESQSLHGGTGMNVAGKTVGKEFVQPEGRWPANIIHDGSEEVLAAFPQAPGQQGDLKATGRPRPSSGRFGDMAPPHAHAARIEDDKSAARFFYCAKASRSDRNEGLPSSDKAAVGTGATMREQEDADWPKRNGNHHPTVKPTELMAYLVRLVTPPGGVVLDPFMGSGSTGKAAMREGFRFIGCDLSAEYAAIAMARIEHELAKMAPAAEPDGAGETLPLFCMEAA